jgi:energy-coupling factor transporter ATP-binding protein EcfA2
MNSSNDKFVIETGEKISILGKTNSGKSTFVRNLIKYRDVTFREAVTRIIYVYKFPLDWFEEFSDEVEFVTDIPTNISPRGHNLLIVDDACENAFEDISSWFLRSARHTKTSIVFIYQSVFNSASEAYKRIINNTDVFVFSYLPKGKYQLGILFRQFFDTKQQVKEALKLYNESMLVKYSYLIFDVRQGTKFQFRRNIFFEHNEVEEAFQI